MIEPSGILITTDILFLSEENPNIARIFVESAKREHIKYNAQYWIYCYCFSLKSTA